MRLNFVSTLIKDTKKELNMHNYCKGTNLFTSIRNVINHDVIWTRAFSKTQVKKQNIALEEEFSREIMWLEKNPKYSKLLSKIEKSNNSNDIMWLKDASQKSKLFSILNKLINGSKNPIIEFFKNRRLKKLKKNTLLYNELEPYHDALLWIRKNPNNKNYKQYIKSCEKKIDEIRKKHDMASPNPITKFIKTILINSTLGCLFNINDISQARSCGDDAMLEQIAKSALKFNLGITVFGVGGKYLKLANKGLSLHFENTKPIIYVGGYYGISKGLLEGKNLMDKLWVTEYEKQKNDCSTVIPENHPDD